MLKKSLHMLSFQHQVCAAPTLRQRYLLHAVLDGVGRGSAPEVLQHGHRLPPGLQRVEPGHAGGHILTGENGTTFTGYLYNTQGLFCGTPRGRTKNIASSTLLC